MSDDRVVFLRPDGTHGRAELCECESWGNLSLPWDRSKATPPPCLYRTPDGEYFRMLRQDDITRMGEAWSGPVQHYVAVNKADAERFIETEGKPPGRPCSEYHSAAEWLQESARAIRLSEPKALPAGVSDPTGPPAAGSPDRNGPAGSASLPGLIDFDALAEALLRRNERNASRLVKVMSSRTMATFQDIVEEVFGDDRADGTVRTMVNRTNLALQEVKSRLHFSTKNSYVIRHIDPA